MTTKRNNDQPTELSADTPIDVELTDAQKQSMILDMQMAAARMGLEAAQLALDKAKSGGDASANDIASVEYQTAVMRRDLTVHEMDEYRRKQEEKRNNQQAALRNMEQERISRETIQAICQHRCGGNGLEDFYRGGHKEPNCIIKAELPLAGMVLMMCVRCFDEVITPDRNMLHRRDDDTDESLEARRTQYAKEWAKFQRFEEMYKDSYNPVTMSGPKFQFERDGVPIHPVRV